MSYTNNLTTVSFWFWFLWFQSLSRGHTFHHKPQLEKGSVSQADQTDTDIQLKQPLRPCTPLASQQSRGQVAG